MDKLTVCALFCVIGLDFDRTRGAETSAIRHLRVTGTLSDPFFWLSNSTKQPEGLAVDVLKVIAPMVGFSFSITPQPTSAYGVLQPDGSWNGLMGSISRKEYDLGLYMGISPTRFLGVEFTAPWLADQIRILVNSDVNWKNLKYLVRKDTADELYLRASELPKGKRIWANIKTNSGFVKNTAEGVQKVLQDGYALVASLSGLAAYEKNNPKLEFAPDVLTTRWGGFIVPKGFDLRDKISAALTNATERGLLVPILAKYNLDLTAC